MLKVLAILVLTCSLAYGYGNPHITNEGQHPLRHQAARISGLDTFIYDHLYATAPLYFISGSFTIDTTSLGGGAETDPVWLAEKGGYITEAEGAVYLQSETDPVWTADKPNYVTETDAQIYLTAETDPQVGAVTNLKWCVGDGDSVECASEAPGGAATWGSITGTVTAQTDLAIYALDSDLTGYVPTSRTVNSKPLTGNIVLGQNDIDLSLYDTITARNVAIGTYVPTTRTVNSKALSSNITITSGDIDLGIYMTEVEGAVYATKGTLTNGKWCSSNGLVVSCTENVPASDEVGSVTLNKWCIGDGSLVQCTQDAPAASAGGSDKQIQFNDGGASIAGASDFYWDKTATNVGIGTSVVIDRLTIGTGTSENRVKTANDVYITGGLEYDGMIYGNVGSGNVCSATITGDAATTLDLTNCDTYLLNSDNGTSTSRTFCLPTTSPGRIIMLHHVAGSTNEIELVDGAQPCAGTPGTITAGVWPAATSQDGDTGVFQFVNGQWRELDRSAN